MPKTEIPRSRRILRTWNPPNLESPELARAPWQFATALTIARANPAPGCAVPSRLQGVERRQVTDLETVEHGLFAMSEAGATIPDDGAAALSERVVGHGCAATASRAGGPMCRTDHVRPGRSYQPVLGCRERFGPDFLSPAPLLEKMARAGRSSCPRGSRTKAMAC